MTSKNRGFALEIFQLEGAADSTQAAHIVLHPGTHPRTPNLVVRIQPAFSGWLGSLMILCKRIKSLPSGRVIHVFSRVSVRRSWFSGRSLGASLLLHGCAIASLSYWSWAFPADPFLKGSAFAFNRPEIIYYYRVPPRDNSKRSLRVVPSGPGARPGRGSLPSRLPALGSTFVRNDLTVISKPRHPDNFRQTIIQPLSPPDLRIPNEMKLPNIVLGNVSRPKAPISLDLRYVKPKQANHPLAVEPAPSVAVGDAQAPLVTLLDSTNDHPRMPIPAALAKPTGRGAGNAGSPASEAPSVDSSSSMDGKSLLIIGVDPSGLSSELALPPGNHWGEFSISPGGGRPESSGGTSEGGGGKGGTGMAGDESIGRGPGNGRGGAGGDAASGNLGATGVIGIGGSGNTGFGSAVAAAMVYPVGISPNLRKNRLLVSVGPVGGGGLAVYQALDCGRIYTQFIEMPGGNWTLEYCRHDSTPRTNGDTKQSSVVQFQLETGLVPPDSTEEYDFHRIKLPPERTGKLIILKGTIGKDGTVKEVRVYRGLDSTMDEAARLAFSRWKFKPALEAGQGVVVDFLVGIPATINEEK